MANMNIIIFAASLCLLVTSKLAFCANQIELRSTADPQTSTIIFFHGLSGRADTWANVFGNQHSPVFAYTGIVLPNASSRSVSIYMGRKVTAWFDIYGFSENSPEDEAGIEQAKNVAHSLINGQIAAGIPAERIVLAGFSQGAALALYAGLTFNQTLGAIVSLSGFLPERNKIPGNNQSNLKTPVFIGHGQSDPLVAARFAQTTNQKLSAFNPNVQFKIYPIGHDTTAQELADVLAFIQTNVPPK